MPLLAGGIGAGVGGLASILGDSGKQANWDRQMKLYAALLKNSPWTGVKPSDPGAPPNAAGDFMQGVVSGAGEGLNIQKGIADQNLMQKMGQAQLDWLNKGYSPASSSLVSPLASAQAQTGWGSAGMSNAGALPVNMYTLGLTNPWGN